MSGIPVKPTSREKIWSIVREWRRIVGLEDSLYFDIVLFAENILYEIIPGYVFQVSPPEEMGNLHGATLPGEKKIRIREDVYVGACCGNGRDRMTIAHEVGHLLMHDERVIEFCQVDASGKIPCYRDSDWQADVFGGELLAPSYLIAGMTEQAVHEACAVSLACARAQLDAVKRMGQGKR